VAKPKSKAGGTPATLTLAKAGVVFTLHPYQHRADAESFGEEAADQLGVERHRIFKTLVAEVAGQLVVAVVPVAGQLDLKALAQVRGEKKAQLADPKAAARSTGYVLGGISPIGQRTALPTVIDASAERCPTIFVSAGRRGLQLELSAADLIKITGAVTADISAG
jgi:Cys-tRNA(Pro)/Cys-tRNA(Cys) deacylase